MKTEVVTNEDMAQTAAQRWREQYEASDGTWPILAGDVSSLRIYERLRLLTNRGARARPEDVAAVVGNTSWTEIECSLCDSVVDRAVHVVDDYGRSTTICTDCVTRISNANVCQ